MRIFRRRKKTPQYHVSEGAHARKPMTRRLTMGSGYPRPRTPSGKPFPLTPLGSIVKAAQYAERYFKGTHWDVRHNIPDKAVDKTNLNHIAVATRLDGMFPLVEIVPYEDALDVMEGRSVLKVVPAEDCVGKHAKRDADDDGGDRP